MEQDRAPVVFLY
jgi:hypothetical protein